MRAVGVAAHTEFGGQEGRRSVHVPLGGLCVLVRLNLDAGTVEPLSTVVTRNHEQHVTLPKDTTRIAEINELNGWKCCT